MAKKLIEEYHFYEENEGEMSTPEGKWVEWAAGERSQLFPGEHGMARLMIPDKTYDCGLIERLMWDSWALISGPIGAPLLLDEFLLEKKVKTVHDLKFWKADNVAVHVDVRYNPEVVNTKPRLEHPFVKVFLKEE